MDVKDDRRNPPEQHKRPFKKNNAIIINSITYPAWFSPENGANCAFQLVFFLASFSGWKMGWQQQQQQQERNRRWTRRTGQKTGRKTTKNKNDADVDADVDDRSIVSSNRVPVRPSFEIFCFFFFFEKKFDVKESSVSPSKKKFKIGRKFLLYFFFFVCVTFCGAVYFSLFSRKRSHALLRFVAEKPSKTQ